MQNLTSIFDQLKALVIHYTPPLIATFDEPTRYDLYSKKNIFAFGKPRTEVFFAGVAIKKNFVGFYFMPIYSHPQQFENIPAELKKTLKGKSCFHIKKTSPELLQHIQNLLKQGFEVYKQQQWID